MTALSKRSDLIWIALLALLLACLAARGNADWLITYPESWTIPFAPYLNTWMAWFVETFGAAFKWVTFVLEKPIAGVQFTLHWLPWSVVVAMVVVLAYVASGWGLAAFALLSLLYMLLVGYWDESMNTLSLVSISIPIAIVFGFAFGVFGYFSQRAERIIMPTLDLLQTIPAFAYLMPLIKLFGFGTVVGLIASVLFAFPPMVRNTILGLRRVPAEVMESGLMSGATAWQLFWRVQIPMATRQILLGVNQTTMAALSMVIIASIIGGSEDIGWEVLSGIRKARIGESILSGVVIALIAMILDRITAGLATKDRAERAEDVGFAERYKYWIIAGGSAAVLFAASEILPFLKAFPENWNYYPAQAMNDGLESFVATYYAGIAKIKAFFFFALMLPARIGLEQTISPYSWGFEFTPGLKIAYAVLVALTTGACYWKGRLQTAIFVAFTGILFYFGLTKLPWPVMILMATFLAWRLGGAGLAAGTFLGLAFLLVAGVWPQTMLSIYLCGIGVVISFVLGCTIGILASQYDRLSAIVRPINDTLQTMPLFVLLIPFLMIFKIGEFTALLAIVAYAIVPAIRYSEHGLRNLPGDVLEASEAMGCTRWQMLWQVKLPLALPVIMLGLNQTILYGISMLVIAALVGTSGLGQQIYIGLNNDDFGVSITAGIGMAIIAMIADRMTQAWSRARREAFGLA